MKLWKDNRSLRIQANGRGGMLNMEGIKVDCYVETQSRQLREDAATQNVYLENGYFGSCLLRV